jgi:hypothetical protein
LREKAGGFFKMREEKSMREICGESDKMREPPKGWQLWLFEVFEKLTSACLSKFHEKPCYYLLIIYIKMFETIVVLTYAFLANIPCTG